MLADRIARISPSATLAMTAKASELRAAGVDVINLSVGEPDFPTPENIRTAGKQAIDDGQTRYTPGGGTMDLKKAVVEKLARDNDLHFKPSQILISCGGKHSLYNACQVLFQKGDEVIFEEFKGTGNQELVLDRSLSDRRVYPSMDLKRSGTRREDKLMGRKDLSRVWLLRKLLDEMTNVEAMEFLLGKLSHTKNNREFLDSMST